MLSFFFGCARLVFALDTQSAAPEAGSTEQGAPAGGESLEKGIKAYRQHNLDQAISDFNAAIKENPQLFPAYLSRGQVYMEKGDFDAALSDYTYAISIKSDSSEAYLRRAKVFRKKGAWENALEDCNKAIGLSPNSAEPFAQRGIVHERQKNFDAAIADYSQAIGLDATSKASAWYYSSRAEAYIKKGDVDLAQADCESALTIDPSCPLAFEAQAMIFAHHKEYDKAWESVRKAQSLGYKVDINFLNSLKKESGKS